MVVALSVLTLWMLLGAWRHMRRRAQIQNALLQETQFRRAMENSMLTGMRALDLDGRITYVNAAFCQMTGWSEAELVGSTPPFPYWPDDAREQLEVVLGALAQAVALHQLALRGIQRVVDGLGRLAAGFVGPGRPDLADASVEPTGHVRPR